VPSVPPYKPGFPGSGFLFLEKCLKTPVEAFFSWSGTYPLTYSLKTLWLASWRVSWHGLAGVPVFGSRFLDSSDSEKTTTQQEGQRQLPLLLFLYLNNRTL